MNALQTFNNEEFGSIRTLTIDNEPWFVAGDICRALGLSNPTMTVQRLDGDERAKFNLGVHDNDGTNCVNEYGLYNLILASRKKAAKDFKRWITHEVLPALRKTGSYALPDAQEQRDITRDDYLRAASIVGQCKNERLPVVMKLLENAGLSIPRLQDIAPTQIPDRDTMGETAALINKAVNEYGIGFRMLERLTGISSTQLYRIRDGKSKPKLDRAKYIADIINAEIERIERIKSQ